MNYSITIILIIISKTLKNTQTPADSLAEETYEDGSTICTQGDEGNFFYIIKEGKAVCSINADGVDKEVAGMHILIMLILILILIFTRLLSCVCLTVCLSLCCPCVCLQGVIR